jgi:hypothetical protein
MAGIDDDVPIKPVGTARAEASGPVEASQAAPKVSDAEATSNAELAGLIRGAEISQAEARDQLIEEIVREKMPEADERTVAALVEELRGVLGDDPAIDRLLTP